MVKFSKEELLYIQKQLNEIMTGEDEACVIRREFLDEQDIKNIQCFINNVEHVNKDEKENKKFIDVVYEQLGFWCFEDYDYDELMELLNDKQFVDLFKKLYLDKVEVE